MEPRLKTSTQWTPFPDELIQQIVEVAEDHFSDYEKEDRSFMAEGRIYNQEILLRVGLKAAPGHLRQDNFEASINYDSTKEKALEQIHLMIDFLAETWASFFEDMPEQEDLSRAWISHNFEKKEIFLRYSTENTDLESQADALLQINEKQLVYGEATADLSEDKLDSTTEEKTDSLH